MRSIQLLAGEMVPRAPTWFSCRVRRNHAYSRSRPGGDASGQADGSEIIYGLAKSFMSSLICEIDPEIHPDRKFGLQGALTPGRKASGATLNLTAPPPRTPIGYQPDSLISGHVILAPQP